MILTNARAYGYLTGTGYGDLSLEQEAFAQAAIAKLWAQYAAAAVKIGVMSSGAMLPDESSISAVNANFGQLKGYISKWASTYLDWARAGAKATTGSKYTIDDWAKYGQELAKDITDYTGYAADSSYLLNAPSSAVMAAKATAETLSNPLAWPWWLQAGAAAAGLFGAAYVWKAFKK